MPPSIVDDPDANADAMLDQAPDAKRYDGQHYDPHESTALIGSFIPQGARVLDVGCGPGSVSSLLREHRGARVVGVEPNAERAAICRQHGIEVHCGFLTPELLATLGKFDAIVFADVLEHLSNPASMLELVKPALLPGGVVVASMPNVANWTIRTRLLAGNFDYSDRGLMDATHLRWFTRKTARGLFERSGFTVKGIRGSAGVWLKEYQLLPGAVRRRLIPWLTRVFPGVFSCQIVICAQRSESKG